MHSMLRDINAHYYFFEKIDSTQTFLHNHPPTKRPVVCRSAQQTAGYGQRGTQWQSPLGQLYFSLRYTLPNSPNCHSGLTQMIALILAEQLDPTAKYLRLKWPNDIFIKNKKCAGILVETRKSSTNTVAIIGVGINIEPDFEHDNIAFYRAIVPTATADTVFHQILPAIFTGLKYWHDKPYLPVDNRWQDYDASYQRFALLLKESSPAQLFGIDQKGRLITKNRLGLRFLTHTRIRSYVSTG